ncbi:MAG: hypothetical protein R3E10_14640 [Gemmatimonadota bacterium]
MLLLLAALATPPDTLATPVVAPAPVHAEAFWPRFETPVQWVEPLPGTPVRRVGDPGAAPSEDQIFEYSDAYLTRLRIHKIASYATLPLFVASYITGNELITKGPQAADWARNTHGPIAVGLGALFGINTITGVWNLKESWGDPEGRGRRLLHSSLLLAADAGFVAAAALGSEAHGEDEGGSFRAGSDPSTHRTVALTSLGVALAGYMTMVWPFRRD